MKTSTSDWKSLLPLSTTSKREAKLKERRSSPFGNNLQKRKESEKSATSASRNMSEVKQGTILGPDDYLHGLWLTPMTWMPEAGSLSENFALAQQNSMSRSVNAFHAPGASLQNVLVAATSELNTDKVLQVALMMKRRAQLKQYYTKKLLDSVINEWRIMRENSDGIKPPYHAIWLFPTSEAKNQLDTAWQIKSSRWDKSFELEQATKAAKKSKSYKKYPKKSEKGNNKGKKKSDF